MMAIKKFVKILLQYLIIVAVTFICIILRTFFFLVYFLGVGWTLKIPMFSPSTSDLGICFEFDER